MQEAFKKLFGPAAGWAEAGVQGLLSGEAARQGRQSIRTLVDKAPKGFLREDLTDRTLHTEILQNHVRNRILKERNMLLNPLRWNPLSLGGHLVGAGLDARAMEAANILEGRLKRQRLKADVLSVVAPTAAAGTGAAGYLLGKKHDK